GRNHPEKQVLTESDAENVIRHAYADLGYFVSFKNVEFLLYRFLAFSFTLLRRDHPIGGEGCPRRSASIQAPLAGLFPGHPGVVVSKPAAEVERQFACVSE